MIPNVAGDSGHANIVTCRRLKGLVPASSQAGKWTASGQPLRQTHGLTMDGLGAVEVLVADADAEQARAVLAEAEAGRLRLDDDADVRGKDPPTSIAEE